MNAQHTPDTRTIRMETIADENHAEGRYTHAFSILAVTKERDALLAQNRALADALRALLTDAAELCERSGEPDLDTFDEARAALAKAGIE
jgi:hypothetical protein